jgi:hypothetical protein
MPTSVRQSSTLLLERLHKAARGKSINEIDQMLKTMKLTEAQRAVLISRRRQLIKVGNNEFVTDTVERTKLSRTVIYRDLQRIKVLGIDTIRRLIGTQLDAGKQLNALVKLPADEREQRISEAKR